MAPIVRLLRCFNYLNPEALVPENHPLRGIGPLVNAARERLSRDFDKIHSAFGRDSIAPGKLLRALLLQAFFSVRAKWQLMEQLTYNMMFRWFVSVDGCRGMGREGVRPEP